MKNPKIVEVKTRGARNNGIIEIIPSAEDMASAQSTLYDEIWINAKKYMIPERTIRLDFLDKAADHRNPGRRKASFQSSLQCVGFVGSSDYIVRLTCTTGHRARWTFGHPRHR